MWKQTNKKTNKMKTSFQSNLIDKKTDWWSQLMRPEVGSEGWEKWVKTIFKTSKQTNKNTQQWAVRKAKASTTLYCLLTLTMQPVGGGGGAGLVKQKRLGGFVTPWTVGCQAPLSVEFSSQGYQSGNHSLLQGIFPTQGLNLDLLHCRWILYCLSHQGNPENSSVLIANLIFQ